MKCYIVCAKEANGLQLCDAVIARWAQSLSTPVIKVPQVGHGDYNWPPMNMEARLVLGEKPQLEIEAFD